MQRIDGAPVLGGVEAGTAAKHAGELGSPWQAAGTCELFAHAGLLAFAGIEQKVEGVCVSGVTEGVPVEGAVGE